MSDVPSPSDGAPSAGRLFLGIPLPEAARRALGTQLQQVELPGRRVLPPNWHLTLAFLGDVSTIMLERLRQSLLDEELGSTTEIRFGGLGAFPRQSRASVLWLGVHEGSEAVRSLHEHVARAVRRAGIPLEDRPFTPHLTLSRMRPPRDVRPLLEQAPPLYLRMRVEEVVLFRSHTGSGPPRYEEVERFTLAEPG